MPNNISSLHGRPRISMPIGTPIGASVDGAEKPAGWTPEDEASGIHRCRLTRIRLVEESFQYPDAKTLKTSTIQ
ncbi:hypothetical protein M7I_5556 [Glarea lozoyensis 74030]|uniref:Uncharacterized protein n=1 Tax=Glarea lozoyensis (strain ATCC 74030 / MF5533) TaxID=1104152 RepID=H0ES78_GLAL7|nr:hypothetical protein M7I_5556 [Glarea lozoyensis 74030]